jgi:hypothetical protein
MKMINRFFFISIESIESLELQYRFGLESFDTEKSVSIDSSTENPELDFLFILAKIVPISDGADLGHSNLFWSPKQGPISKAKCELKVVKIS